MTFNVLQKIPRRSLSFCHLLCHESGEKNLLISLVGRHPNAIDPGDQDPASSPTKEDETKSSQLPTFHCSNLVGCAFLVDPQEDSQRFPAHIIQAI